MDEYDIRGYEEKKSVEPLPEHIQRANAGLPPKAKSNSQRQKLYRERLKAKLGSKEFKKQQAEKMKAYRKEKAQNTTVDESKISNKQTRGLVNNLLKTIEERIITMINQQKENPQIPIHFEAHIRKDEISPVLVNINNSMSNQEVVDAFVQNDRKNPRGKRPASEKTFTGYLNDINKFRKLYFGLNDNSVVYNDFAFLKDTDRVLEILKENYSHNINTYNQNVNSISAILARLNHYQKEYINVYKPLNTKLAIQKKKEQLDSENKLTDREKKGFTSWDRIIEMEDEIKNTEINPVENLVIYYLYTQLPPRRLEFGSLVIAVEDDFEDNGKTNYVVLDKKMKNVKKIILNKYKTSEVYGPYIINDVPPKLSNAIVDLIDEQDYKAGEHLFMNSKGKPYGNAFSSRVKEVFEQAYGKPITLNTLRHSFISYHLKNNPTQKQKTEWANAMGHSTDMQGLYNRIGE